MSMALNPDRATLNFLNAFPEEIRLRGEKLQKDGAVTQIFGNHLYIQGRVEDAHGVHRVNLRLQGNRWFGACSTEDEDLAGAAMYAAMLERMYRGQDLPESPNELNDVIGADGRHPKKCVAFHLRLYQLQIRQHVDLIFYGTYVMLFDIRLAPAFFESP